MVQTHVCSHAYLLLSFIIMGLTCQSFTPGHTLGSVLLCTTPRPKFSTVYPSELKTKGIYFLLGSHIAIENPEATKPKRIVSV